MDRHIVGAIEFFFLLRADLLRSVSNHHQRWPIRSKPVWPTYWPGQYAVEFIN